MAVMAGLWRDSVKPERCDCGLIVDLWDGRKSSRNATMVHLSFSGSLIGLEKRSLDFPDRPHSFIFLERYAPTIFHSLSTKYDDADDTQFE